MKNKCFTWPWVKLCRRDTKVRGEVVQGTISVEGYRETVRNTPTFEKEVEAARVHEKLEDKFRLPELREVLGEAVLHT